MHRAQLRSIPDDAFVVTSELPDTNQELDWLLRDRLFDVPVRWQTGPA